MSEQEQPQWSKAEVPEGNRRSFDEWLTDLGNTEMQRWTSSDKRRCYRELRQRDEELTRLRAQVEECKRSHWVRVEGTLGQTVRYEGV